MSASAAASLTFPHSENATRKARWCGCEIVSNMAEAPEIAHLTQEERRFWRRIEGRALIGDGTQELTLACGHCWLHFEPLPEYRQYAQCPACVSVWLAHRQPVELPTHCAVCGALLKGGATKHAPDCSILAMIRDAFPGAMSD